jgi:hypothetical protein
VIKTASTTLTASLASIDEAYHEAIPKIMNR